MNPGSANLANLFRPGISALAWLERLPLTDRRDLCCVLLAVITLVPFLEVVSFDFINYDDTSYVTGNPHVRGGLRAQNIAWAFTTLHGNTSY
jgi:hypothetical protein